MFESSKECIIISLVKKTIVLIRSIFAIVSNLFSVNHSNQVYIDNFEKNVNLPQHENRPETPLVLNSLYKKKKI